MMIWFCPWDGFPMDRPNRNSETYRCKQCRRWVDAWYPPKTVSTFETADDVVHLSWRGIPLVVYKVYERPYENDVFYSKRQTKRDAVYIRVELDYSECKVD